MGPGQKVQKNGDFSNSICNLSNDANVICELDANMAVFTESGNESWKITCRGNRSDHGWQE